MACSVAAGLWARPPARVGKGGRASLMIQFGSRIVQSNGLETQLVILEEAER
jgi:hypothetical protein